MGYPSAHRFLEIASYLERHLSDNISSSVLELGDQTFVMHADEVSVIENFLGRYGAEDKAEKYKSRIGETIFSGEVYRDAGIEYACVDLNQNSGAVPLDLNIWPNPLLDQRYFQKFDLVTNFGTTEHAANQTNAFAITHYLSKKGGVIFHEIPMLHYSSHAMVQISPLFLKKLIDWNGYEILTSRWQSHLLSQAIEYHYDDSLCFLDAFVDTIEESTQAAMGYVILRNTLGDSFVPPLDIAVSGDAARAALKGYIEAYAHPLLDMNSEAVAARVMTTPSTTEAWIDQTQAKIQYTGRRAFLPDELDTAVQVLRHEDNVHAFEIVAKGSRSSGQHHLRRVARFIRRVARFIQRWVVRRIGWTGAA